MLFLAKLKVFAKLFFYFLLCRVVPTFKKIF
jgi:hypothetical protein